MTWVDGLRNVLVPSLCALCGAPAHDLSLCPACVETLPWNQPCCPRCALPQEHEALCADCAAKAPPYAVAWCPLRLEQPVQSAIHGLKYQAHFLQAHTLGRLMAAELVRRPAPLPQRLIPVPLYRTRLRRRGYNQALELARVIARQTGIVVDTRSCTRLRDTRDQIGMSAAQRQRNVRGAFAAKPLKGLHIALLDDVMTTGATLSELARVCRRAGAARIEAWAVARVA